MKHYKEVCSAIFSEHEKCERYKSGLGRRGLYEQSKQNKRFYDGDQWYGARTSPDKPLVRQNIIKRLGEYKTSVVAGTQIDVSFTPAGVNTKAAATTALEQKKELISGNIKKFGELTDSEILLASEAFSSYFNTLAKRINFDAVCNKALTNAYITGTGAVHIYWDPTVKTGLFADDKHTQAVKGDICAEVIDIQNIDFHDPSVSDVQNQEFIIISSRKTVESLKREARLNGIPKSVISQIKSDECFGSAEADYSKKATVLTKFYKKYDESGRCSVYAIRVCKGAIIKKEWDTGLSVYPIALFSWDDSDTLYCESEITNIIPNQIAINRMLTAAVWATMMSGMPIMLVNSDVIDEPITNNPGQIISFTGEGEDFEHSIKYIEPPTISKEFDTISSKLIENTLSSAGATSAALGELEAKNTSAIIAVEEASRIPLNMHKKRYLAFIETLANLTLEFMFKKYRTRNLIQKDKDGVWYFPFDSSRYSDYVFFADAQYVRDELEQQLLEEDL